MSSAKNRIRRTPNYGNSQGDILMTNPDPSSHARNSMTAPGNSRHLSRELPPPPFTSTMANPWARSPTREQAQHTFTPAASVNTAHVSTPSSSSTPTDFSQTATLPTETPMNANASLGTKLQGLRTQASPTLHGLLHRFKELKDNAENSNKSYQQVLGAEKQKLESMKTEVQNIEQLYLAAREKVALYEDLADKFTLRFSDADVVRCLDIPNLWSMVDEAHNCQEAVRFMLRRYVSIEDLRSEVDAHCEAGKQAEASRVEQEKLVKTLEKEAQMESETQEEISADLECLSGLAERWEK